MFIGLQTYNATNIATGLSNVQLEGRFQKLVKVDSPTVYLDVTHNPQGASVLKSMILDIQSKHTTPVKVIALLGMLKDKDSSQLADILKDVVDEWITAPIIDERGQSAEVLAEKIQPYLHNAPQISHSIAEGCALALQQSKTQDIIIVFGSFHMMAESLTWFKENQYV